MKKFNLQLLYMRFLFTTSVCVIILVNSSCVSVRTKQHNQPKNWGLTLNMEQADTDEYFSIAVAYDQHNDLCCLQKEYQFKGEDRVIVDIELSETDSQKIWDVAQSILKDYQFVYRDADMTGTVGVGLYINVGQNQNMIISDNAFIGIRKNSVFDKLLDHLNNVSPDSRTIKSLVAKGRINL